MSKKKWAVLIFCNTLAFIMFFSWVSTQTVIKEPDGDKRLVYKENSSFWKTLDYASFQNLNGQLKNGKSTQSFWAFTNRRIFDLVSAFSMILIYSVYIFRGNQEEKVERVKGGLYMSVSMLIALGAVQLLHGIFYVGRLSPTKLPVDGAIRLSELSHIDFEVKDASKQSFPGDHSAVLFMIATFITYYAGRFYAVAAILVATGFVLPRMVGGGHWLTDIVVGGGAMTLITASWALCTPVQEKANRLLHKPTLIFMGISGKLIPALKPAVENAS